MKRPNGLSFNYASSRTCSRICLAHDYNFTTITSKNLKFLLNRYEVGTVNVFMLTNKAHAANVLPNLKSQSEGDKASVEIVAHVQHKNFPLFVLGLVTSCAEF